MIRTTVIIIFLINIVKASLGQEALRIVDDQFAEHPFGADLSPSTIHTALPGKIAMERKAEPNKHTRDIDTLLIFKSPDGKLTFLKTIDKVWLVEAVISGRGIKLARGIKIGLSKDNFIKIFSVDKKFKDTNPIIVTNTIEYGFYHSFYFEKGKLAKIVLNAWPD